MNNTLKAIQSVSGTWINRCQFADEQEFIGIVHLASQGNGDKFLYWGENFDREGQAKGTFASELVDISWPEMKFAYGNSGDSEKFESGTVTLSFESDNKGLPVKFIAEVEDKSMKDRVYFESRRLNDDVNFTLPEDLEERAQQLTELISANFKER